MRGQTMVMATGCGKLYVTINEDEHGPFEVFAQMGKAGGCAASQTEALARMISLAFRSGVEAREVITQLKGISCHLPSWEQGGGKIVSCADAIAKALERVVFANSDQLPLNFEGANGNQAGACPDCGGSLEHAGGCIHCRNCGYTRC
jgi:ribonucleoside-diphosphate reductase alpha chain